MADEDIELEALRRRAYGPAPDIDEDPAACERLRELEAERRAEWIAAPESDPVRADGRGDRGPRVLADRRAVAGPDAVDRDTVSDSVTDEPARRSPNGADPFDGPDFAATVGHGTAPDPDGALDDLAARASGSRAQDPPAPEDPPTAAPGPEPRPRWFSPALVGTSAVAAVVVMLVAGAAGWGGGFLAGWARAASPAEGMELVTVLEEVELAEEVEITDDVRDSLGSMLTTMSMTDVETGETTEHRSTYFGRLGEDVHVVVPPSTWGNTDTTGDSICLEIMQVEEADGESMSWHGASACGSRRSGVTADVYATAEDAEQFGPGVALDEFAPGTLLRFIYDDQTKTVAVWSLAPVDEDDPGA